MSTFLAICGRQPELSAAELSAALPRASATLRAANDQVLLVDDPSIEQLFPLLGGFVKLGKLAFSIQNLQELGTDTFFQKIHPLIAGKGKVVYGVSAYGGPELQRAGAQLGKALKVFFTSNGRPARFLNGERGVLSSVVVAKERLMERGAEFLLVPDGNRILIGVTVAVQAFEDFSRRDYGRPERNQRSGMLPPKLARIMVHLAELDSRSRILDPFCGSGTILQEALLLGFRSLAGSDRSPEAIAESQKNLAWLAKHEKLPEDAVALSVADIRDLGKNIRPGTVDAIVTEPFLGPPQRGGEDVLAIRAELEQLYAGAFRVFARLLRPGGKVVFAAPAFFVNQKPHCITNLKELELSGFKLQAPLPASLNAAFAKRLSFRQTLVYQREGQRVGREVLIFQRS